MSYEGYIDRASPRDAHGWAWDASRPHEPLTLEIVSGAEVVGTVVADGFRPDLLAAGKGDGRHAFSFDLPASVPTGASSLVARVAGKGWVLPRPPIVLPPREHASFHHALEHGYPGCPHGFTAVPADGGPKEGEVVARVAAAFRAALRDDPAAADRKPDVWLGIHDTYHRELAGLLLADDVPAAAAYLRDVHARDATHGLAQGRITTEGLRADPDRAARMTARTLDALASLAEYLGLLDLECPEHRGRWGENLYAEPRELVRRVSERLGVPLVPPAVIGSRFGILPELGCLSYRDVLASYAAVRVRELAGLRGHTRMRACEIGGGLGGVAYYACLSGAEDYTVVDLPLVNALQGYYLLRALPQVDVRLYGEPERGDGGAPRLRILPGHAFLAGVGRCDLLLNMDSLPEMHADYAVRYLSAARSLSDGLLFLSINQESRAPAAAAATGGVETQTTVRDLAARAGGYRLLSRGRHWLRPGYAEETYDVSPAH